jgi:hypothetical protein
MGIEVPETQPAPKVNPNRYLIETGNQGTTRIRRRGNRQFSIPAVRGSDGEFRPAPNTVRELADLDVDSEFVNIKPTEGGRQIRVLPFSAKTVNLENFALDDEQRAILSSEAVSIRPRTAQEWNRFEDELRKFEVTNEVWDPNSLSPAQQQLQSLVKEFYRELSPKGVAAMTMYIAHSLGHEVSEDRDFTSTGWVKKQIPLPQPSADTSVQPPSAQAPDAAPAPVPAPAAATPPAPPPAAATPPAPAAEPVQTQAQASERKVPDTVNRRRAMGIADRDDYEIQRAIALSEVANRNARNRDIAARSAEEEQKRAEFKAQQDEAMRKFEMENRPLVREAQLEEMRAEQERAAQSPEAIRARFAEQNRQRSVADRRRVAGIIEAEAGKRLSEMTRSDYEKLIDNANRKLGRSTGRMPKDQANAFKRSLQEQIALATELMNRQSR